MTSSEIILGALNDGKLRLFFGKGCPACESQFGMFDYPGALEGDNVIDVYNPKNKNKFGTEIKSVPTWVMGEVKVIGSHHPDFLVEEFGLSGSLGFGSSQFELSDQPQFMGETKYGGRRGGQLPCSSEHMATWTNNMSKFGAGGLLKRPYGPSDNFDMTQEHLAGSKLNPLPLSWNYTLGQFGSKRKKKKRRSKKKKRKSKKKKKSKSKKKKKRRSVKKKRRSVKKKRKFGTTPGTDAWKSQVKKPDGSEQWVNPKLAPAKGYNINPVMLYLPTSNDITVPPYLNIPKQYTNNQYNNPQPNSKVNFGNSPVLVKMEGPNNVAYRKGFDLYGAGANTTNWATGKTFRTPKQPLLKVQKTANNPTSYISNAKTIPKASGGFNTARGFINKGIKNRFGELVYTRDNMLSGAKGIYQPNPPYMNEKVHGSYATYSYGKKKHTPKTPKELTAKFGGKVITLNGAGKITIV